jgi:hypothetical protein
MNKSNSITFTFENCECITIPSKFIHTLKIIKPQINNQHIYMDIFGNFDQDIQNESATFFLIVITINERYKQFLEDQYVEKYKKKPSDLDQLVNHSIQQLKRDDIVYCVINDNNKTIEPEPIYLHWIGDMYQNEALSYIHGKNKSNKDKLDELLCIISTSLPKDDIAELTDEIDYLFNLYEATGDTGDDNDYNVVDKHISPHLSL